MLHTHRIEYRSAIKKELRELLTYAMDASQTVCCLQEAGHQIAHTVWFHLYEILEQAKLTIVTENRSMIARGWRLSLYKRELFGVMEIYCVLIMMLAIQVYHFRDSLDCVLLGYLIFFYLVLMDLI